MLTRWRRPASKRGTPTPRSTQLCIKLIYSRRRRSAALSASADPRRAGRGAAGRGIAGRARTGSAGDCGYVRRLRPGAPRRARCQRRSRVRVQVGATSASPRRVDRRAACTLHGRRRRVRARVDRDRDAVRPQRRLADSTEADLQLRTSGQASADKHPARGSALCATSDASEQCTTSGETIERTSDGTLALADIGQTPHRQREGTLSACVSETSLRGWRQGAIVRSVRAARLAGDRSASTRRPTTAVYATDVRLRRPPDVHARRVR